MQGHDFRETEEYLKGKELMNGSRVSICSIVRDCESNLRKNISRVESLRSLFKDSEVVVFENDSKDNTLKLLKDWERRSKGINVFSETYKSSTIPPRAVENGNPFYSIYRIDKMAAYRNKYMRFLNDHGIDRDYVIVVDLDITNFCIDGIIHSFGAKENWDCISANGTSLSSKFVKQYHDSYALIEKGEISNTQTEQSIKQNRIRYAALKEGDPLVRVDSAFGGLAIYKWYSIKNTFYSLLDNNNERMQCKSEHVGLHKTMKNNGYVNIYINPSMKVKYRSVTLSFLFTKAKEKFLQS